MRLKIESARTLDELPKEYLDILRQYDLQSKKDKNNDLVYSIEIETVDQMIKLMDSLRKVAGDFFSGLVLDRTDIFFDDGKPYLMIYDDWLE